jgi:hypothetical protein
MSAHVAESDRSNGSGNVSAVAAASASAGASVGGSSATATATATQDAPDVLLSFLDHHIALCSWWQRHNKEFSLWFLAQPAETQRALLVQCCPDMPIQTPATRELYTGSDLTPTDMLIPELTQEALLSNQGKLCILLITRRCVSTDHCLSGDAKFLNTKFVTGMLPAFPEIEESFRGLDTPFVDPADPKGSINCSVQHLFSCIFIMSI